MADPTPPAARSSYPYMSKNQWFGVRNRLKQSPPRAIDIDWVIAALDATHRTAQNVLPQLKTLGLIDSDGRTTELVHDLRDDESYASACASIIDSVYPESLRSAHDDPSADPTRVASWFSRNARVGDAAAKQQATLYLTLLGGTLPSPDDAKPSPRTRKTTTTKPKTAPAPAAASAGAAAKDVVDRQHGEGWTPKQQQPSGTPTIHVDLQIHISADTSDSQIDSIFQSMAKHLYGR
ncbi:DUF5343 domain-containing protein [Curtobacterium sp. Arg-1]|uniref:DUF5343 domain-containing protein n=1 Tax=Curtobacterium sp. Arg-1 TaxID=2935040 RepID=UPI0021DB0CF3|nr:DUF5343 domain-containing protein [Curtobacterium sp. Arg-1]UXZ58789.1 DUF5343 domain-containing protein [Curtobacterium sp. Arg-1]